MSTVSTIYDITFKGNSVRALADISKNAKKANSAVGALGEKLAKAGFMVFGISALSGVFSRLTGVITKCTDAYRLQAVAESKLATIMRNTMQAYDFEIDAIKRLAAEQQKLGVIGAAIQLSGAQELSTYVTKRKSVEMLLPVMNDMLAQQYGLNASQEQATTIAQMMGKVLDGQVGALSRYGYRFDDAQEAILKFGNEEQRVAMLAQVIAKYVGGVNAALAATPEGKLKQHANDMSDLHGRIGKLFTGVQSALLPLREKLLSFINKIVDFFDTHIEQIKATVTSALNFISSKLSTVAGFIRRHAETIKNLIKVLILAKTYTVSYAVATKACAVAMAAWRAVVTLARIAVVAYNRGVSTAIKLMFGLNNAVKLNPIGLLVGVVTAAIAAFALFRKRADDVSKSLDNARKTASSYYAQERTQLDMIFAKLRDSNPKSRERNTLVNELLQMYPELNREQAEELRNTNNLAAAYETLAQSIAKKARIKGAESALEKLSEKTQNIDMVIEDMLKYAVNRRDYKNDEDYAKARGQAREYYQNTVLPAVSKNASSLSGGNFKSLNDMNSELNKDIYGLYLKLKQDGVLFRKVAGSPLLSSEITDGFDKLKTASGAYAEYAKIQKFLADYMFDSSGQTGGRTGSGGDLTNPGQDAVETITGGGRGVKNFYINIENLLRENTNIFQSSKDDPASAGDFVEKLNYALEDVVNDVNYAGG
ncbi:MAG: hypothetical protein LBK94_08635 [Prevotellaceae bacterium]|jgi:hypothetical protein|nr:hypothetical protein [Prevotellaceae bacterium]